MSRKNGGIIGPANTPVGGFLTGVASGVWRTNDLLNFVSNSQWPKTPENIENSCRFNEPSSDNLSRSISSTGSTKIVTFSAWIKRGVVGGMSIFSTGSANTDDFMVYMPSESIQILARQSSSTVLNLYTNRVLRDVSAWYHVVAEIDTTQSTESNRAKLYINGVRETSFSTETYPSQNQDLRINESGYTNYIGNLRGSGNHFDGYMAEIVLIDGQALDPTSFGETDSTTGIWKPKKIGQIANAGNNSFYLNFKDSSNLGKDESGLSNNFTVNNLTSVDQAVDTCVENFATMSPIDFAGAAPTLTNGNLTVAASSNDRPIRATMGFSKGKWYAEYRFEASDNDNHIGCHSLENSLTGAYLGANLYSWGLVTSSGDKRNNGTSTSYGSAIGYSNSIVMIAIDKDNGKIWWGKDGTWFASGDPANGTNEAFSNINTVVGTDGFVTFADVTYRNGSWNFGSPSFSISSGNADANGFGNFEYAVPSGFYALNTSNLNTYG